MTASKDIETYIRDKSLEEKSPYSTRTYRQILRMFEADMKAQGLALADVKVEDIRQWLWKKRQNGSSSNWLRLITVVLKNFYDLTKDDLKTPRAENVKAINVLSNKEIRELYQAAYGIRDKAIIEFGYHSGARRAEVERCCVGDVDFGGEMKAGSVRILGKGRKIRNVPLSLECVEILRKYLDTRGNLKPSDPLFTGRGGGRLTAYGLEHILRRLRTRVSFPDAKTRVHFHMLRHAFAKHLYQAGVKIRALQQLLGHASVAITERYLVMLGCEVAEEYELAAPALSLTSNPQAQG